MGSITGCIREALDAGLLISAEDKAALMARVRELLRSGVEANEASKQAVAERLETVANEITAGTPTAALEYEAWQKGSAELRAKADAAKTLASEEAKARVADWHAKNPPPHDPGLDIIADQRGFTSADEMLQAISDYGPKADVVQAMTDQRMLERHGEFTDPKSVEDMANEALHNEAAAKFLATGLKSLTKTPFPAAQMARAAKEGAITAIGNKRIIDINPRLFINAEQKTSRQAQAETDLAKRTEFQRAAMLNNALARAATDALAKVDKGVRHLKRVQNSETIDPDYVGMINGLLERYDLLQSTNKAVVKRVNLREYLNKLKEETGQDPDIPKGVIDEARQIHYKELTADEFTGLIDSVKALEHLGRLKNKLLIAQDQRTFDAHMEELVSTLVDNAMGRQAKEWDIRETRTVGEKVLKGIQDYGSNHIKIATRLRVIDGKEGGAWWNLLGRTANDAANWKAEQMAKATETADANLEPITRWGKAQKKKVDGYTLENIFVMGLNMGNAGNKQRMFSGNKLTPEKVIGYLQLLPSEQLRKLQDVWDHVGSFKELIREQEMRSTGREPEWVDPEPLTVTGSDGVTVELQGGYFPIKYDRFANATSSKYAAADDVQALKEAAYTATQTRKTFVKPRADEVYDRALSLSLRGYFSGVQEVIHDLAWRDWVTDANRTLRDSRVDDAIRSTYGAHTVEAMKDWVTAIATNDSAQKVGGSDIADFFRHNSSFAGLAFNTMTAAIQPLGITQSAEVVGYKWIGKGLVEYMAHPIESTRRVKQASALMRDRSKSMFRELAELNSQIEGQGPVKKFMRDYGYWLISHMQQTVDVPTFLGAYEKAIADPANLTDAGIPDEAKAIALAEQAVIDSQGSGRMNDLSAIQRGNSYKKLFTVFYNFNNLAANIGYMKSKTAPHTPSGAARLAVSALMLTAIPAILMQLLRDALTPGDSGNYDDEEKIAKTFGKASVSSILGMFMGAREIDDAVNLALHFEEKHRNYEGPAGLRVISDFGKAVNQISQGEYDEAFRKAMINLSGSALGMPSAAINRLWTGAAAINEGDVEGPEMVTAPLFGVQK